jgi:hypothetical protein
MATVATGTVQLRLVRLARVRGHDPRPWVSGVLSADLPDQQPMDTGHVRPRGPLVFADMVMPRAVSVVSADMAPGAITCPATG